jgi:catechol 2,3-dioxygenase-like lactoylglutathione lyase family enzyme
VSASVPWRVPAAPARLLIWYRVRDLDAGAAFFRDRLGFEETKRDEAGGWVQLRHGETLVELAEGDPDPDGPVAVIEVENVKADADRLRGQGIEVGVVLELHGAIRLLDVYDPDGNRIQLTQDL